MELHNEPIITIRGLEKSFGTKKVLKGIDLDVLCLYLRVE